MFMSISPCHCDTFNFKYNFLHAGEMDSLRTLYYNSVNNEKALEKALLLIDSLREKSKINEALLTVYEGSLLGLKGKHAISPRRKYAFVMKSIPIMEKARQMDSTNVEILFIQGTTTHYLPFFFYQKERAEKNFRTLIRLLPDVYSNYPDEIVINVIGFLEENSHLYPDEKTCVEASINQLRKMYEE
jgi:hypothetical protein